MLPCYVYLQSRLIFFPLFITTVRKQMINRFLPLIPHSMLIFFMMYESSSLRCDGAKEGLKLYSSAIMCV